MPSAVRCCLSVTWWHLAEPNVISESSVVTVDCLMTFVSIYCCSWTKTSFLLPTVTQRWQGCRKFILCLLGAWPGPSRTCIDCGRLSLFRLGWCGHFPVDVKGQLPGRVQVKFSLSVFLISSSIIPLPSFSAFVLYLKFSNSLVVLTWGSSLQIRIKELCHQNLTGLKREKRKQWAKSC